MTHFKRKERDENLRLILTRSILRISRIWTKWEKWEKYKLERIKYLPRWHFQMRNRTKTWTYRIIASLVGIGILVSLVYYAGFEKFFGIIIQTSLYWIIISVIIYAMSWIFRVQRLERFTRDAGEKIGFFKLFKLLISGYTLNILLPARLGDVATIFYLKMNKIAFEQIRE